MTQLNKKDYYQRAVNILTEISTLEEDLKELTTEFKYSKDENPQGVPKKDLDDALSVAKVYVKDTFSKKEEAWKDLEEAYAEYVE